MEENSPTGLATPEFDEFKRIPKREQEPAFVNDLQSESQDPFDGFKRIPKRKVAEPEQEAETDYSNQVPVHPRVLGSTWTPKPEVQSYEYVVSNSEQLRGYAAQGEIELGEYHERFHKWISVLPVVSSGGVIIESGSLLLKANRLENDDYGPEEGAQRAADLEEVLAFQSDQEEMQARGTSWGSDILWGASESLAMAGELMLSGGTATGAKVAAKEALQLGIKAAVKSIVKKFGKSVLTKQGLKTLGKKGARVAAVFAPRVQAEQTKMMLDDSRISVTDKGKVIMAEAELTPGTAYLKSIRGVAINALTELWGGKILKAGAGKVISKLDDKLVKGIVNLIPKNKVAQFAKGILAGKIGVYDGLIAEMGEERIAGMLTVLLGGDEREIDQFGNNIGTFEKYMNSWLLTKDKDGNWGVDGRAAGVEIGIISLMGGGIAGGSYAKRKLTDKWRAKGMSEEGIENVDSLLTETEKELALDEEVQIDERLPEMSEAEIDTLVENVDLSEGAVAPTETQEDTAGTPAPQDPLEQEALKHETPEAFADAVLEDVKDITSGTFLNLAEQVGTPEEIAIAKKADKIWKDKQEASDSFVGWKEAIGDDLYQQLMDMGLQARTITKVQEKYPMVGILSPEAEVRKDLAEIYNKARSPEISGKPAPTGTPEPKTSDSSIQGLSKADGARLREETGLNKLDKPVRRKWETALKEADPSSADAIAQEVINNPRTLTDSEQASLVVRAAELANQHEALVKKAAEQVEAGSPDGQASFGQADAIAEQIETLTRASDLAGTEAGRALSIRRMMVSRESFKITDIVRKAVERKGEALTQEEKIELTKLVEKLEAKGKEVEALQKSLEEAEERASKAEAEKTVKKTKHSRKADKATIKKDREAIKAELKKLGMRVNDITGVSVEASIIIGKLAKSYVQEGALTLDEVVKNVQRDVPDVSTRDIWDSISGRGRESRKKVKSEIEKRVASIKKQADLLSQIEDAAEGVFDKPKTVNTNKEVKALRKKLNALRDEAMRGERDGKRLNDILRKIDQIRDDIEAGVIRQADKKKKRVDSEPMAEAKKKLQDLRNLLKTEATLKDLMEQLQTGKYKIQPMREVRIVSSELELARAQVSIAKKEIRQRMRDLEPMTFMRGVSEVAQFARTIKATADRSGVLRQAAWMANRMPKKAAKAVVEAERAAWSEDYYHLIDGQLRNIADEHGMTELGLELTETGGSLVSREEDFASDFAERIPGLGAVIKNSNRHMVTYLNMMRVESMKRFILDNPTATKEDKQTYARFINVNSGRGDLGKFDVTMGALSKLMFAPRFGVSRFQVGWMAGKETAKAVKSGDWLVAKEIGKDYGAYVGTRLAILAMVAAAFDDDDDENYIGWDWNDADFGKIVMGPMRLDMWSGHAQPARLLLSIADGTMSPYDKDFDPMDDIGRFLMYKLSPAVSTTSSLMSSKDFLGREQPRSDILMKALMPIIVETALETIADGRSSGVVAGTLAAEIVGIGVGVYDPSQSWKRGTRTWTDDMKEAYGEYEPGRASTSTKALDTDEWTDAQKAKMDRYYWKLLGDQTAALLVRKPKPSRKDLEKISKRARDAVRREFRVNE